MEATVRRVRQVFGETLPADFLSSKEYSLYERLYGPPLQMTRPEDVALLHELEKTPIAEDILPRAALMKENVDGDLEEVDYKERVLEEDEFPRGPQDIEAENRNVDGVEDTANMENTEDVENAEDVQNTEDDVDSSSGYVRSHPLTIAGRFATSPATLRLPKDTFIDPVTSIFATYSNKHLTEAAERIFGGPGLPNSAATPKSKRHLQQRPVALEASQSNMSNMEANVYLAAIMPAAYATVMGILVEVRKRLGSEWVEGLLKKDGGPRFLDAGAGGAAALAWRDVVKAEWARSEIGIISEADVPPQGKTTVVTGSSELRRRASQLLENTTFLPRLPDYVPARDLVAPGEGEPPARKQYDVIVAPHTLWTLKEDYMRKAQVQNLWSLLNPDGGVLILVEKGLPRGFELIAAARETLLKNQIASPDSLQVENELQSPSEERFLQKENGMIIAPCTNHFQCPMYTVAGQTKGRKDFCHFSQRYHRPPFLQDILGAKDRNHEDVKFSYVAVQRGKDKRRTDNITQGISAADAAFAGYNGLETSEVETLNGDESTESPSLSMPNTLSLPRSVLPPIKCRGHVILDLCTPAGRLERWTVPKSFGKQAYRDARKSQWGDLWGLGAKTRVLRNVRLGTIKDGKKTKGKGGIEVGLEADEEEDTLKEFSRRKSKYDKRTKKVWTGKSGKNLREDNF
ncbi:Methyltransferase-like protein 17, mitochondrial [Schaereria dolodes]|nr:Methyltransferase-like protein 17, mitochondrial [Schaereria dolodes]